MKKIKCPICGGKQVTKKGKRETRYKSRQIYYCKSCGKKFVENKLRNKTYSPKVIINAISYYNLGFTLDEASRLVNRRFKVKTSKSSVHNWINEFSDVCSFRKMRDKVLKDFDRDVVFTNSFEHQGLEYKFRYHKAKLKKLASNYPGLVRYLERFEEGCPSEFFEGGERCSQLNLRVRLKESGRRNQACKLAELALKAVDYNRQRHEIVEKFMLMNDTATIASEIPVWLWEKNLDVGILGI